jgi:hypothetical protein
MAAAGINRSGSFFSRLRVDFARIKALAIHGLAWIFP